ncbi:MAG: imelysin family protein [Pseudomonadota bacterium]
MNTIISQTKSVSLPIVCLVMAALVSSFARAEPVQSVSSFVRGFVQPGFTQFSQDAQALASSLDELCRSPSSAALKAAQNRFRGSSLSWSRIELVQLGPLSENNAKERILFWPDRRGRGLRQVQALLAKQDPSVLSQQDLQRKSVAVQGLGALEYILFGAGSDALIERRSAHRCGFGRAIARSVSATANSVLKDWNNEDGFTDSWVNPKPDAVRFRTRREAESALLSTLSNALSLVVKTRVMPLSSSNPRAALFWRSQMSIRSLRSNLQGIEEQLGATGFLKRLSGPAFDLDRSITFEFKNADRMLQKLENAENRSKADLEYLAIVVQSLEGLVADRLAAALGLPTGFSPTDGD